MFRDAGEREDGGRIWEVVLRDEFGSQQQALDKIVDGCSDDELADMRLVAVPAHYFKPRIPKVKHERAIGWENG